MVDHSGWYPPGQVCYPPDLPGYLKEVYDLRPVVGLPSDDELIGIHSVIHVANRVSVAPGMNNPRLLMNLADHLFNVQMARYRSRYSLVTFPTDATYTPPTLPTHVPVSLEPVSGVPTDDEMIKVQDAVQTYQDMRRFPSMFDAHVNMELSQHLFDLQMARHMRTAGESQPSPASLEPTRAVEQAPRLTEEVTSATNNAGTGAVATEELQVSRAAVGLEAGEPAEQSNRGERSGQLSERSIGVAERFGVPADQPGCLAERFNQVLERFTQVMEQSRRPTEQSERLAERLDQFFDRFTEVVERVSQRVDQSAEPSGEPLEHPNQPAEQSSGLANGFNELLGQLNQHFQRSSVLTEELTKPMAKVGDALTNINKVLVGIQHAIIRGHKGDAVEALDCLVNLKGDTFVENCINSYRPLEKLSNYEVTSRTDIFLWENNHWRYLSFPEDRLGELVSFYGLDEGLCKESSTELLAGKVEHARERIQHYMFACLN